MRCRIIRQLLSETIRINRGNPVTEVSHHRCRLSSWEKTDEVVPRPSVRSAPTVESAGVLAHRNSDFGIWHRCESSHLSSFVRSAISETSYRGSKPALFSPRGKVPVRWSVVFLLPGVPESETSD